MTDPVRTPVEILVFFFAKKFGENFAKKTVSLNETKDMKALKWGFGEERNGELWDSKTRKSGVKYDCSHIISHYNEVE